MLFYEKVATHTYVKHQGDAKVFKGDVQDIKFFRIMNNNPIGLRMSGTTFQTTFYVLWISQLALRVYNSNALAK